MAYARYGRKSEWYLFWEDAEVPGKENESLAVWSRRNKDHPSIIWKPVSLIRILLPFLCTIGIVSCLSGESNPPTTVKPDVQPIYILPFPQYFERHEGDYLGFGVMKSGVSGRPEILRQWWRNGKPFRNDSMLTIDSLEYADSGWYEFRAINALDSNDYSTRGLHLWIGKGFFTLHIDLEGKGTFCGIDTSGSVIIHREENLISAEPHPADGWFTAAIWVDGISDTTAVRNGIVLFPTFVEDHRVEVVFEKSPITVGVVVNDSTMGKVLLIPDQSFYHLGDTVRATYEAAPGNRLKYWKFLRTLDSGSQFYEGVVADTVVLPIRKDTVIYLDFEKPE